MQLPSAAGFRAGVRWADGGGESAASISSANPTRRFDLTLLDARQPRAGSKRLWCSATAATYGLRFGEAAALRQACGEVLTVRSSPYGGDRRRIAESTTKTKRDRHVPVPEPRLAQAHVELLHRPRTPWCSRRGGRIPASVNTAGHSTTPATRSGSVPHGSGVPRPRWRSAQAQRRRATSWTRRQSGDDARPAPLLVND